MLQKVLEKVSVWMQAARPRTLVTTVCPVCLGASLAIAEGMWRPAIFLFTLFTALAIQIGTNVANDYFDFLKGADTPSRKGPVRVTQAKLIPPETVRRGMFIIFSMAALLGSFLIWEGGLLFALCLALAIGLGILYTAGRYSLAYLGIADIFVFLFFGPVATLGTYVLQTHTYSREAVLVGMGPGALAWSIFLLNNLRDIDEDRIAGKKTLCVRGGKNFGCILYSASLTIAFIIPWIWVREKPLLMLAELPLVLAAVLLIKVWKHEEAQELNPLFKGTMGLLVLYTSLFILAWHLS